MKTPFYRQLAVKFLIAMVVAFIVSSMIFALSANLLLFDLFDQVQEQNENATREEVYDILYDKLQEGREENAMTGKKLVTAYNRRVFVALSLGVIVFLTIFIITVRPFRRYLRYMSEEVKNIGNVMYLEPLKIKGKDELAELAQSINIMSSRLKEQYETEKQAEQQKNDLITAMSHDLRTPLTSIIGYMELLQSGNYKSEQERQQYEEIAYKKSLQLQHLINELFHYTKLMNPKIQLERERMNVSVLLQQMIGESIPFFMERDIEVVFQCSEDIELHLDAQQMIRVFENLIKNAEKYASSHSTFVVEMKRTNQQCEIRFQNEAEPLTDEEVERLFEQMYRRDSSRSSELEGSGLGLTIAKKIVELHQGTLTVQHQGTTICFTIHLPL